MRNKRYYLAHSCTLIGSVRRWELYVQGHYNIDLINPFRGNKWENVDELVKLRTKRRLNAYVNTLTDDVRLKIVKYDLELLRKCDGLVAVFNEPSIGTVHEIFAAAYLYAMPVYVISRNYTTHPWIVACCKRSHGRAFTSRKAFEQYLEKKGMRRM